MLAIQEGDLHRGKVVGRDAKPLGNHAPLVCVACHAGGVYAGTASIGTPESFMQVREGYEVQEVTPTPRRGAPSPSLASMMASVSRVASAASCPGRAWSEWPWVITA